VLEDIAKGYMTKIGNPNETDVSSGQKVGIRKVKHCPQVTRTTL